VETFSTRDKIKRFTADRTVLFSLAKTPAVVSVPISSLTSVDGSIPATAKTYRFSTSSITSYISQ